MVKWTYRKVCHFLVCGSVALGELTLLCNHLQNVCAFPSWNSVPIKNNSPLLSPPRPLEPSLYWDLMTLCTTYRWNYTVILLCPASVSLLFSRAGHTSRKARWQQIFQKLRARVLTSWCLFQSLGWTKPRVGTEGNSLSLPAPHTQCKLVTFLPRWPVCQQNTTLKAKPSFLLGGESLSCPTDVLVQRKHTDQEEPGARVVVLPLTFSKAFKSSDLHLLSLQTRSRISSSVRALSGWNPCGDLVIFLLCLKSSFPML